MFPSAWGLGHVSSCFTYVEPHPTPRCPTEKEISAGEVNAGENSDTPYGKLLLQISNCSVNIKSGGSLKLNFGRTKAQTERSGVSMVESIFPNFTSFQRKQSFPEFAEEGQLEREQTRRRW